ncbi:MAG: hypothetical protein ACRCXK_04070 [Wohlfahrtiimonas sp.]
MLEKILNDIKTVFYEDVYISYDKNNPSNACLVQTSDIGNYQNIFHWTELLDTEQNELFTRIEDWVNVDTAFNYFIPAIMSQCLIKNFYDDILLYLMEKFDGYHNGLLDIAIFYEISTWTKAQRTLFLQFLGILEENTPAYSDECKVAQDIVDWCDQRDILLDEINTEFPVESSFKYDDLIACDQTGTEVLTTELYGISWIELACNDELIKGLQYDMAYASLEVFYYYIPAYMVNSLNNICNARSDALSFTLLNIECNFFSLSLIDPKRQIIIDFIKLIALCDKNDDSIVRLRRKAKKCNISIEI